MVALPSNSDPGLARAEPSVLALPGPVIASWERQPTSPLDYERPEFARRDASLSPRGPTALLGSRQWLEPAPPPERRVRFFRWRQ